MHECFPAKLEFVGKLDEIQTSNVLSLSTYVCTVYTIN